MNNINKGSNFIMKKKIAIENLVPYSKRQPAIFNASQLTPVKDLKLLTRDYAVRLLVTREIFSIGLVLLINFLGTMISLPCSRLRKMP